MEDNALYFVSFQPHIVFNRQWSSWTCLRRLSSYYINSLALRRYEWYFTRVILKLFLVIDGWVIYREFAVRWMSLDVIVDKSTIFQVKAWCRQADLDPDLWHHMASLRHNELTPAASDSLFGLSQTGTRLFGYWINLHIRMGSSLHSVILR